MLGAALRIGLVVRIGHRAGDRHDRLRVRAPCHHGRDRRGVDGHCPVEARTGIGREGAPPLDGAVERVACGRPLAAAHIGEGRLVGRDQPGAGAHLHRHVADRHAARHVERRNRLAAELDRVAVAAGRADQPDHRQREVLGRGAEGQGARGLDLHVAGLLLHQRLRRQHLLDLGGADAEGERSQRPVRRGVRIAAHDRLSRQREAKFGADHVDDTLSPVEQGNVGHAECSDVRLERCDLRPRLRLVDAAAPVAGRDIVIDHCQRRVGPPDRTAGAAQPVEGLRAVHLVEQVTVDIEHARLRAQPLDDMRVPDLVVESARPRRRHVPLPVCANLAKALCPCNRRVRFIRNRHRGR